MIKIGHGPKVSSPDSVCRPGRPRRWRPRRSFARLLVALGDARDQRVQTLFADFAGVHAAVIRHQAHAFDRDVVDLPVVILLVEGVVNRNVRPAAGLLDIGLDYHLLIAGLADQRQVNNFLIGVVEQRGGVGAHQQVAEFRNEARALLGAGVAPVLTSTHCAMRAKSKCGSTFSSAIL